MKEQNFKSEWKRTKEKFLAKKMREGTKFKAENP